MTDHPTPHLRTRLRLKADDKLILGPGRLQILRAIAETGSIAAAARTMGMSYRRAWLLVDDINRCFRDPLVESVSGGKRGGGARLTVLGDHIVTLYTELLAKTEDAIAQHKAEISALLANPLPEGKPDPKEKG